jgi:carbon-monoxide dehydrogenase small subunit
MTQSISVKVNGESLDLAVADNETLFHLVKDTLGLVGTKDGCRQGVCGSCTVLIDGMPIRSCMALAARCDGKAITTIEGLRVNGEIHPLQQAFIDAGAVQCGYCTPGILLTMAAYLEENPKPTEDEVREALIGNLCRCTGYARIIGAVMKASST